MRTRMAIVAVVVAVGAGSIAAQGAEMRVDSDKTTYNIGETISLTVKGDDGDSPPTDEVIGYLLYSGALTDPGTGTGESAIGTGWIVGTQSVSDGIAYPFDQISGFGGQADFLSPGGTSFA